MLFYNSGVGPDHYVWQQEVQEDSPSVSSLSDPVSCKYTVMEKSSEFYYQRFYFITNDIFLLYCSLHNYLDIVLPKPKN